MESFDRILVRAPNWLGDVVMATPLLRVVRETWPRAHIGVVCSPGGAAVLDGLPFFDEVIPFRKNDLHRGVRGMARLARELRKGRFDLAICCPNSFSSALALRWAAIPRRVGWSYGGRGFLLTDRLVPAMKGHRRIARPMPEYYLDLARHLGCEILDDATELGVTASGDEEAARFLTERGVVPGTPLVGLNVGASFGPSKLWHAKGFADVATRLRATRGMRPIVLCGPGEEALGREIEDAVRDAGCAGVVRTSDVKLSIAGLKSLVKRLTLLVTTDTGPRHFALAYDVPCVCVMGSTDPRMTDQPRTRSEVVRLAPILDCMPCHEKVCPLKHHKCLEDLGSQPVLAACDRVLALPPTKRAGPQTLAKP
ncbi:MAG: lipopolysaccharide heptosyltransferase II [Planctomycetes bacterium]|nr:lipopolysaccharide heptosyltransferase II [Planctomycetota bacterium]